MSETSASQNDLPPHATAVSATGGETLSIPDEDLTPIYAATIVVLTWGFRAGAGLLTLGLLVAVIKGEPLNHAVDPFGEVIPMLLAGRAAGLIDLAILWLMGTPVVCVLVVAAGFFQAGDRRYAVISLLVLAVLGVSIALALFR